MCRMFSLTPSPSGHIYILFISSNQNFELNVLAQVCKIIFGLKGDCYPSFLSKHKLYVLKKRIAHLGLVGFLSRRGASIHLE